MPDKKEPSKVRAIAKVREPAAPMVEQKAMEIVHAQYPHASDSQREVLISYVVTQASKSPFFSELAYIHPRDAEDILAKRIVAILTPGMRPTLDQMTDAHIAIMGARRGKNITIFMRLIRYITMFTQGKDGDARGIGTKFKDFIKRW